MAAVSAKWLTCLSCLAANTTILLGGEAMTLKFKTVWRPNVSASPGAIAGGAIIKTFGGTVNRGAISDIAARGNFVYYVGGGGLSALDVRDPFDPKQTFNTTEGDGGSSIALWSDLLLMASPTGLRIYDIGDPSRPKLLAHPIKQRLTSVSVSGEMAYVAAGGSIHAIPLSNLSNPAKILANTIKTPGPLVQLALDGPLGVMSSGRALSFFQIQDAQAREMSRATVASSGGPDVRFVLKKGLAFATGGPDLVALDYSQPSELVAVGKLPLQGVGFDVAVDGGIAAVGSWSQVEIIDVSDPSDMRRITSLRGQPYGAVCVDGPRVYAGRDSKLDIIDLNAGDGGQVAEEDESRANSLALLGERLVLQRPGSLEMISLAGDTPTYLGSVAHSPLAGPVLSISSTEAIGVAPTGRAELISSASGPQWLTFTEVPDAQFRGLFAENNGRILSAADGFLTLYSSVPIGQGREIGRVSLSRPAARVALGPRFSYHVAVGGHELVVVDWANPSSPRELAAMSAGNRGAFSHVVSVGDHAVVAARGFPPNQDFPEGTPPGVYVVDPNALGGPKVIDSLHLGAGVRVLRLRAFGNRLYVVEGRTGFRALEVIDGRLKRGPRVQERSVSDVVERLGRVCALTDFHRLAIYQWERVWWDLKRPTIEGNAIYLTLEGSPGVAVRLLWSDDLRGWHPWGGALGKERFTFRDAPIVLSEPLDHRARQGRFYRLLGP